MSVKSLLFVSLLSVFALLCACGEKTGLKEGDADSSAVEGLRVPDDFLPDTTFSSVDTVDFTVENAIEGDHSLKDLIDAYAAFDGKCIFRGTPMRDASFGGSISGTPTQIDVAWRVETENGPDMSNTKHGSWGGGSGWTGQPVYVHWTPEDMDAFRKSNHKVTNDFSDEEIIVGSLCGKVYFINYQTGKLSREPMDAGNPVKGSVSLDPNYKNLYVGQGINSTQPFGCMVFDLLKGERTQFVGSDAKAQRAWNAFDSNAIVAGGYLFWCGENGSIYKYQRSQGGLTRVAVLRYRVGGAAPGVENSLCVYRNYGYFADNMGNVLCVNLNTMRPVWYYNNHDDTDGTIVCCPENGIPYVYTACEVDKQGHDGNCHFVKLNGLTGEKVWETKIPCCRVDTNGKTLDGGMYSTPLVGMGDCAGMLFFNICRNKAGDHPGELTAISTKDGNVLWTVGYEQFAWSSPVAFVNDAGEMYVFTGDASGTVWLVKGLTGEVVCKRQVGNNFESSPVVVGNTAVMGSRGNGIYKFVIK